VGEQVPFTAGFVQEEPFQTKGAVQVVQVGGLLAPLVQELETQEEPFQTRGAVQVLQVGGLLAPLAQEFGTQAVPFQV